MYVYNAEAGMFIYVGNDMNHPHILGGKTMFKTE